MLTHYLEGSHRQRPRCPELSHELSAACSAVTPHNRSAGEKFPVCQYERIEGEDAQSDVRVGEKQEKSRLSFATLCSLPSLPSRILCFACRSLSIISLSVLLIRGEYGNEFHEEEAFGDTGGEAEEDSWSAAGPAIEPVFSLGDEAEQPSEGRPATDNAPTEDAWSLIPKTAEDLSSPAASSRQNLGNTLPSPSPRPRHSTRRSCRVLSTEMHCRDASCEPPRE